MNKVFFVLVCCYLTGCSATTTDMSSSVVSLPAIGKKSLTAIDRIRMGMTEAQVRQILGDHLKIGYKADQPNSEMTEDISIPSPYKVEDLQINGKPYRIFYYQTTVVKPDGLVSDDELTPLIFQNDKLIGKSQDVLFKLRRQYQ